MANKVKVGLIGCGNISGAYVTGCRRFEILEVVACADIIEERAAQLAIEADIPAALSVEELLNEAEIDVVINLTVPKAHAEVSLAAIAAGKHVYSEKPLAIERGDGLRILEAAGQSNVRIGCAPDTFLGGGLQSCRKLLDDGWIGQPVGATAFMMGSGPESWHPNPHFFYQSGAGPLFDIGPYYLTALVNLLGPIERVAGSTRISFEERYATSQARYGEPIRVEVASHATALLNFTSGPIGVLITSFDVQASELPRIEIYGSQGTLSVPDPNTFGGPVRLRRKGSDSWHVIPLTHSDSVRRGIGVADLAYGITSGREHRASGQLAYHVLDVMQAVEDSSQSSRHVEMASSCQRPAALPLGLLEGRLDI